MIFCGGVNAQKKDREWGRLCQRVGRAAAHKTKKRPAPEGAGLPGVVPFDIVNWEGNYILDTNTFLIVMPLP